MTKRIAAALLATLLTVGLAACATGPGVPTGPAVGFELDTTADQPVDDASVADTSRSEDFYLQVLDIGDIYYTSSQTIIDLGYGVCRLLDSGGTVFDAATAIADSGAYSDYEGGYIAGTAKDTLCVGAP